MNLEKIRRKDNVWFLCNSCLAFRRTRITPDLREGLTCSSCGLNSRQRAVLFAAQKLKVFYFFGKRIRILGVSDGHPIRKSFESRFGKQYRNYEYHVEPKLDITDVAIDLISSASITTCSEVLEHVQSPISSAFLGLNSILMPGGWAVISVPHKSSGEPHVEHFPILHSSRIVGEIWPVLIGTDANGNEVQFSDLVFHGGAGSTLEYRVFSEDSLRTQLALADFIKIESVKNYRFLGIFWEPWSRVWIAQKPF